MIRIYMDWGVISNLKKEEFSELMDFISLNKNSLLFPYSPAHFNDLMKSYGSDNHYFEKDLAILDFLCETHFLNSGDKGVEALSVSPKVYFETEKNKEDIFSKLDIENVFNELDELGFGAIGESMRNVLQSCPSGIEINDLNRDILKIKFPNLHSNSTMWDFLKELAVFQKNILTNKTYYKEFRQFVNDTGFKVELNSGNWDVQDVFKNIDAFLVKHGMGMSFREYVNLGFKHRNKPVNEIEYYTAAYLLLDVIGYKSDKLPKSTDNMQNIQNDAEHGYYSAHCDYFVVSDKHLAIKTKALFKEFQASTSVISPEELLEILKKQIHVIDSERLWKEAFSFVQKDNLVEYYKKGNGVEVDTWAFKLPLYYFDFYNYVIYQDFSEQNTVVLTFRKVFKNASGFVYYTEAENLVDRVCSFFGCEFNQEYMDKRKEFVYGDNEITFSWYLEEVIIRLEKEKDTNRPVLIYTTTKSHEVE